jgi:CBS domain-containing protein
MEDSMTVRELLQNKGRETITASPAMTVPRAMELLIQHQISCLPVVDLTHRLIGIVSDKDIFRLIHKYPFEFRTAKVGDIMSTEVIIGTPTDDLMYIAGVMTRNRIRHIPVVSDGHLVGLVSIGDIVKARMSTVETENRYLWQYIEGSYPA